MLRDPNLIPLSHQHHNGLAMCVLTRRSLREDASPANVARLARRAIDRYELELVNHFEIEEQILFPAIEKALGKLSLVASLVERAERLEHERDQHARLAAVAERTRIAREIHDVLAHSLGALGLAGFGSIPARLPSAKIAIVVFEAAAIAPTILVMARYATIQ